MELRVTSRAKASFLPTLLITGYLSPPQHSVVRNALFCLETAADEKENHVYTKALMAYTFALAGKEEKRKALLSSLEKEAVKKGECSWWHISFFQPTGLISSFDKLVGQWL